MYIDSLYQKTEYIKNRIMNLNVMLCYVMSLSKNRIDKK